MAELPHRAKHPTLCFFLDNLVACGVPQQPLVDLLGGLEIQDEALDVLEELCAVPPPETYEEAFARIEKRGPKKKAASFEKRAKQAVARAQARYEKRFEVGVDAEHNRVINEAHTLATEVVGVDVLGSMLDDLRIIVADVGARRFGVIVEQCIFLADDLRDLRAAYRASKAKLHGADPSMKKRSKQYIEAWEKLVRFNAMRFGLVQATAPYSTDELQEVPVPDYGGDA